MFNQLHCDGTVVAPFINPADTCQCLDQETGLSDPVFFFLVSLVPFSSRVYLLAQASRLLS